MDRIKEFFMREITGWKKGEIWWLLIAVIVIASLSIYWGDNLMGIISSVTGVACVVCTGKGKLSAYLFGLINCILYAIISYKASLYGETMLNVIYYIPMQFIGFVTWNKNMNISTASVQKRRMSTVQHIWIFASIGVCTVIYGVILRYLGDTIPFIDSFTTVASVFAMIISVKMYTEQWYIWIAVNVMSVIMWIIAFINGTDSIATLLMWIVYLFNSVIMCVKWEREARKERKNEV